MIRWRSPVVLVTAVAAVVGAAFMVMNTRERRAAADACQTEEASEDCKQRSGYYGGYYGGLGVPGRAAPRAMTGPADPNAPLAANAADAQNQSQTQRSGFGSTGRSRGYSGG